MTQDQREREVLILLRQLWIGLSTYRLYPGSLDRPGFVASAERIRAAAERALASGPVDVEIRAEGFVGPAGPLPHDDDVARLARACFERRAERLWMTVVPEALDLAALFRVLAAPPAEVEEAGGPDAALEATGTTAVSLSPLGPEPVAGADHVLEEARRRSATLGRFSADLLIEDLHGLPDEQAATVLDRLRSLAASAPEHVPRDAEFHRRLYGAVIDLPPDLRRSVTERLVDRILEDPFADRLITSLNNAELTRALVDLGRDPRRDPVELARQLARAGVRPHDIVDLTAALAAGHEEAGTIMAGLEQMGMKVADLPNRTMRGESISDVMAEYLAATEQEDLRSIGELYSSSEEARRASAALTVEDYVLLESDIERLEDVLEVWADTVRGALRRGDRGELWRLLPVADRAAEGAAERAAMVTQARRRALDPETLGDVLASDEAPALLEPFGAGAVEALLDLLAEESDRSRRALLVGLLGRLAVAHPDPVVARLADERWYVVRNAVVILGRAGGSRALDRLAQVAGHPERAVRREVATALVQAGGASAVPMLRRLAADAEEEVRGRAVEGLGSLTSPEAARELADVARTGAAPDVRRRAVEALGRHPAPEAMALLRELGSRRGRPRLRGGLRRLARSLLREREGT